MGVDVTLYVADEPLGRSSSIRIQLPLERNRSMFIDIAAEPGLELPFDHPLYVYGGPVCDECDAACVTETPYGTPLTYSHAGRLAEFIDEWHARHADNPFLVDGPPKHTRAAVAYLRQLDAGRKVVLWWH